MLSLVIIQMSRSSILAIISTNLIKYMVLIYGTVYKGFVLNVTSSLVHLVVFLALVATFFSV